MNRITSNASFAIAKCKRFTQFQGSHLRAQDSIQQTIDKRNAALTCGFINRFDRPGTLRREPIRGSERAASRIARSVAIASGIVLSILTAHSTQGSIDPIQSIKELADYQLTESQEYCHNQIIYRESRFKSDAINGSHYGYYQGKSKVLLNAPDDYQFYWYYSYVSNRYGVTRYDEPNYCKALHHLRVKGWQ